MQVCYLVNVREFHTDVVKKRYGPLRKGVETKHSAHLFNGKVRPTVATAIFTDVGQGYRKQMHQTSPGPRALGGTGFKHSEGPVWNSLCHYQENHVCPWSSLRICVQGRRDALWLWRPFQTHPSHVITELPQGLACSRWVAFVKRAAAVLHRETFTSLGPYKPFLLPIIRGKSQVVWMIHLKREDPFIL